MHINEVVVELRQNEDLVDTLKTPAHYLTDISDSLASAKHLLKAFVLFLAEHVSGQRMVRFSIAEPLRCQSLFATYSATQFVLQLVTKPTMSWFLSAPTEMPSEPTFQTTASICSAAYRSAGPVTSVTYALTTRPWRLSVNTRPI